MRVEGLAGLGGHALEVVGLERGQQGFLGQLQPGDQAGLGGTGVRGRGLKRPLEIVGHAQKVAGEALDGIGAGVVGLGLGALLGVLGLGHGPQGAVLPLVALGDQGIDGAEAVILPGFGLGLFDLGQVLGGGEVVGSVAQVSCPSNIRPSTRAV
eukprot:TRINITY_DN18597_c0_g1_i1.p1 TRINITY_DN18597_c0_g1~~TRINITY_DN18597_c0_g1_i1.p1  ORF type:complete len:154 (+),score=4.10 TRINITY_DN18597_c0_g1_i1:394-855(+)